MTRRLIVRSRARRDIEEAIFWYQDQRPGLGEEFAQELKDLLERIAAYPLQFPSLDQEVRRGLLHRFPYTVYFAEGHKAVTVLAVLHQSRHPDTWKQRR